MQMGDVIYLSIRTKLFTHLPMFVCPCAHACPWFGGSGLQWEEGDKPAREKCAGKLDNRLFTSFISHACFSLANTFKSICHPFSHASHGDLRFVSLLDVCLPVGTPVFRHKARQKKYVWKAPSCTSSPSQESSWPVDDLYSTFRTLLLVYNQPGSKPPSHLCRFKF